MTESNSCCSTLLKLKCWLILAKYGTSKLKLVEQITQDAALDEFEMRFALRRRFLSCGNTFLKFARNIYEQTTTLMSKYISSPDWSIFYEHGIDSMWQLNKIIRYETELTLTTFPFDSHSICLERAQAVKEEICTIINGWSDITCTYWNYTSAALSAIFAKRMDNFVNKYENCVTYTDFVRIVDNLTKNDTIWSPSSKIKEEKHEFWFLTESLNFPEDFDSNDCFLLEKEENLSELSTQISDWLFKESIDEFRVNTVQLLRLDNKHSEVGVFDKGTLSAYLAVPEEELSFTLLTSSKESLMDINLAEGPHYSFDDSTLIELRPSNDAEMLDLSECVQKKENIPGFENDQYFDLIDSVLQDIGNEKFDDRISEIKVELNDFYETDAKNFDTDIEQMNLPKRELNVEKYHSSESVHMPKLQIIGRHEVQRAKRSNSTGADGRHRKRGRPRKVDDCQATYKNGQHKYSPENVLDCSNWISDNFIEIPGNKPAIDRARLYELYTNYCTLKFCVPVDRALFGKIIRKVFPQLKSRRLIQNQVLKYHYVGLKPKFAELEHALMSTDFSNPQEIFLSYEPVEE